MQTRTVRSTRPHRGVRRFLISGGLGLASACLNPDISDEPPISESAVAIDAPDAGAWALEQPFEPEPEPEPTQSPQPSPGRRDGVTRNPARR